MRAINFRGKTRQGEWVFGYHVGKSSLDEVAILPPQNVNYDIGYINDSECYYCIADTIGQFTGLYDKNGKEVYEGDIIGCADPAIKHLIFYSNKQARFMAGLNGETSLYQFGICSIDKEWMSRKVVIGNIIDNPELLQ